MNQIAKAAGISKNSSGLNSTAKGATPLYAFAQAALAKRWKAPYIQWKPGAIRVG